MSTVLGNKGVDANGYLSNLGTANKDSVQLLEDVIDSVKSLEAVRVLNNFSVTQQSVSAAARTYIVGSALAVPTSKLQIGTQFVWQFNMTKTAAGSAASTIDLCFGVAGTTSDTARVSFTKPAGTAAGDEGLVTIVATVRGPLSASGVVVGTFQMTHNLASTGHMAIPAAVVTTVSSAFDVTTAGLIVGVCLTTGASDVITIDNVQASCRNLFD